MKLDIQSLQALCEVHAVAGDTQEMILFIQKKLHDMRVETKITPYGVLLCGNLNNPKMLLSAHCDEVGFQVAKKNPDGTFLVRKSGHVDAVMLNNSPVYVQTQKGKVVGSFYPKKELGDNKPDHFSEVFLDTLDNTVVSIGDFGSYIRSFYHKDDKIIATGLDNKIGVELVLELIKEQPEILKDTLIAFVTEEETTYDCIAGIAAQYTPEYALVIDMLPVHQTSPGKVEAFPQLGEGPGILWGMSSYHIHFQLKEKLKTVKIPYTKVFIETTFPPEPQIVQKNGVTKGMNILVPMLGWHNATYTMHISDYSKTKELVSELCGVLRK